MNKTKIMVSAVAGLLVLAVCAAQAGNVVGKVEDKGIALRVKNGWSSGTMTVIVTSNGVAENMKVGLPGDGGMGLTNTVTGTLATNQMGVLAGYLAACTNKSGEKLQTVDSDPSLTTADTCNSLLNGTYTAQPGQWLEIPFDTSVALHLDLYFPSNKAEKGVGAYEISGVSGCLVGTGAVTVNVYKGGVLVAQKIIESPVYGLPAVDNGDAATTNLAFNNVSFDWPLVMPLTGSDAVIVRCSRATTATTGALTATVK